MLIGKHVHIVESGKNNRIGERLKMFCSKCGKEISEDWKACPYCGNEINVNVTDKAEKEDNSVQ